MRGAVVICALLFNALTLWAAGPELWYRAPAAEWKEALPIGDGKLAAMVFGGVSEEHLQLNEETVFAGKRMDRVNPKARASLETIRKLLLEGKVKEAEALAASDFLAVPLRQPPYETLGELTVKFYAPGEVSAYRRSLDLTEGVARVEFSSGGVRYVREAFVSYPDNVLVLHVESSKPKMLSFKATLSRPADATVSPDGESLVMKGIALPPDDTRQYQEEPRTGATFYGRLRANSDGKIEATGQELRVDGATEATLAFTASSDVNHADAEGDCRKTMERTVAMKYVELRKRHTADFEAIAKRVTLLLGTGSNELPTDELLAKTAAGGDNQTLAALYFAYGRYLLESSSRQNSLAANLQGKWNQDLDPPWGSKYTININTEMNYWPAEVCDLPETVDGLFNLLTTMHPTGQRDAKEIYGTAGFVAHHNTDVWGDAEPIDGVPYGVWPMGAAWLTLALWNHYEFSGDVDYLRDRAYPLMRDAALYVADNLFSDGAGHLVSGPSLSPENRYLLPDGAKASLDVSPTFDVEVTRELFGAVIKASKVLRTDQKFRKRLEGLIPQLMPYQIGRFGQLQEWRKDYAEAEPGHRHISHLFAVYPGSTITAGDEGFWKAARVSLERRLANGGGYTGWSRAWVTALWAAFGEGDKADESLQVLFSQSTWPNLFDTHPPHYFQIDGNLGGTAAIAQMLIQSRIADNGRVLVNLLPALPASWAQGRVSGLRIKGGATVDMEWSDHKLKEAVLRASRALNVEILVGKNPERRSLHLAKGGTTKLAL